MGRKKKN